MKAVRNAFHVERVSVANPYSPCVQKCVLNEDENGNSFCTGCNRTLDEIRTWQTLSLEEQRRLTEEKTHFNMRPIPPVNLYTYSLFLSYVLTKGETSLYSIKQHHSNTDS